MPAGGELTVGGLTADRRVFAVLERGPLVSLCGRYHRRRGMWRVVVQTLPYALPYTAWVSVFDYPAPYDGDEVGPLLAEGPVCWFFTEAYDVGWLGR